ncbi:MAG TPA: hypothetical protein VEK78_09470 [Gemmatimonadales bacterium]|nr:hypothetical protein [Gemmatimonadales bacterium]
MTQEPLPFDHRPDPVLGAALRQALDPGDAAAFVAVVLARADETRAFAGSWHGVLARWARVGLGAAVLLALAGGYLVERAGATGGTPSVTEALIAPRAQAPEVEVVLASVLEP